MDVAPNQTIYVANLQQKIKKQELKQLLFCLFGQFGKIIDIVTMRTDRLRGQAWIVFSDISAATAALRGMQDFPFFEKPMRVSFAKSASNAVSKKKGGKAAKGKPPKAPGAAADGDAAAKAKQPGDAAAAAAGGKRQAAAVDVGQPNPRLFVEDLPSATTAAMLEMLFQQFPGCKEVTTVPAKPGIAFIQFETEMQASNSESAQNRFAAPLMRVSAAVLPPFRRRHAPLTCCRHWNLPPPLQLWYSSTGSQQDSGYAAGSGTSSQRRALAVTRRGGAGFRAGRNFPAPQLKNLVLVACHSVYTGLGLQEGAAEEKSSWFLLDYQKEVEGQTHSFVQHIQLGVREAAADPDALLLFSGGKTRKDAGPRAEGEGYWLVAEAAKWYGTEGDRARDSFENLLFGLCRFYELSGRYPDFITVVGYDFKQRRFSDLHRAALRLPEEGFRYEGTPALNAAAVEGEEATAAAFEADPYGCGPALSAKREARDPYAEGGYTGDRCPAMAEILQHCGPELFDGPLPWDGTV
ncbi:U2 small nuclear ribonucleoprotein B'' [Chlorella vulgaris]